MYRKGFRRMKRTARKIPVADEDVLKSKTMASENAIPVESTNKASSTSNKRRINVEGEKNFHNNKVKGTIVQPLKRKKTNKTVEKVKKGKEVFNQSIRLRTSPNELYKLIQELKEPQKEAIREMGFGSLLSMKIDKLSGTLGYFVVDILDVDSMVMHCSTGQIHINRKAVRDMLGIPMGNINLISLEINEVTEDEVPFSSRWKSQFKNASIRPSHLSQVIQKSDDTSLLFKCNFLILFTSLMISSDMNGGCIPSLQKQILDRITEDTNIQEIDWCGFLLENMKECKNVWPPPGDKEYYFTGPMTFLQLLYLDSTICEQYQIERERPAIKYWNNTYIQRRVKAELEANGSFGKLQLQPAFSEYVYEERFTATTSGSKVVESSSPSSNEEYHSKIDELFIQLKSHLKKGVLIFPNDLKMLELNDKFQNFFRDAKGELLNDDEMADDGAADNEQDSDDGPDCDKRDGAGDGCNDKADGVADNGQDNDEGAVCDQTKNDSDTQGVSGKPSEDCCIDDVDELLKHSALLKNFSSTMNDNAVDRGKDALSKEASEHQKSGSKHYVRKRLSKPKNYSSPYKLKETDVNTQISTLEFTLSGSVFLMNKEPSEILFETQSGKILTRALCESLAPEICVYAAVIDTWSAILNEEQLIGGKSITRLFLNTSTIARNMWDGSLSFDEAYKIFDSNMKSDLEENVELLSMKNIEIVFFPIIAYDHFYLVVFNLQRTAFNIIDNSATCDKYNVKYKTICDVLHRLFYRHLEAYKHQKASAIQKVRPAILKMKWRTLNNHVDCGVFVMCHMDTYLGQAVSKWDPGFVNEVSTVKVTQKLQLNKLRAKYCTKILLHESNIHKEKIIKYSEEFRDRYDVTEGKKAIQEAVRCRLHVLRV